jgi:hypothetical protein
MGTTAPLPLSEQRAFTMYTTLSNMIGKRLTGAQNIIPNIRDCTELVEQDYADVVVTVDTATKRVSGDLGGKSQIPIQRDGDAVVIAFEMPSMRRGGNARKERKTVRLQDIIALRIDAINLHQIEPPAPRAA